MTGKDWFILAVRLVGLGMLYLGIQEALAYVLRDILFANLELSYFPQPYSGWSRLFHGAVNVGLALLALGKAESLADWCYGKDAKQLEHEESQRDAGMTFEDEADNPSDNTGGSSHGD